MVTVELQVKWLNLGKTVFKFSFAEVYRRIYGRKLSFIATRDGAVKRDFRTYIRRYTSPNEKFEYRYPHSIALLQFRLKIEVYQVE